MRVGTLHIDGVCVCVCVCVYTYVEPRYMYILRYMLKHNTAGACDESCISERKIKPS